MNRFNANDLQSVRQAIDAAIAGGDFVAARAMLATFDLLSIDAASASYIISRFERMKGHIPLRPFKLAILRSFTLEPIAPVLRAVGLLAGLDIDVRFGGFKTFSQELLDANSFLDAYVPDAVFLAVQARDIAPVLWERFTDLNEDQIEAEIRQVVGSYRDLISAYRARHSAPLVVHNLQLPPIPSNGAFDAQRSHGQVAALAKINRQLTQLRTEFNNVYLLDYDGLVRRRGDEAFHDPMKWMTARMPIAAAEWVHLAREWLRFLCPLSGRICKALAVDLDNTLWGGVVGEDGFDGIKLDDQYPGAAYLDLQRAMLDLHRRGVLLAICSKNNPAEALDIIDRHPGMLLRREHFAAIRINWDEKSQSVREIARELNVGTDAIAFLDDNPVEREGVRRQVPEVTVIELPADPMRYGRVLRESPVFERLELTADDRQRGRYYAEQRERDELRQGAGSLEDFYRSLQMRVHIAPLAPGTLARAAQLTQKTNQFNLTTRRYTEQQLSEMLPPRWSVYTLRAEDRFGDNGVVGLAILKFDADAAEIDTFLLSCRVIGRTIETAFLAALAQAAAEREAARFVGWFYVSAKNAPARDFYSSHGFIRNGENDGGTRWELPLPATNLTCPKWIDCEFARDERTTS